jgi:5'-3' exonuclease
MDGVDGMDGIGLPGDARQAIKQAATSKVRIVGVVPCRLREVQVHLIDGTYELFRQWFGAPQAQHQGREVGAVRSMIRSFAMLLSRPPQLRPDGERDRLPMTHVGVAFDHVIESFRNDLFPGYKTGDGLPEGLTGQFELAERVTSALGLTVWPMVEFEADDAIATAAHRLAAEPSVARVLITAVDKDMCQCVIGDRVVCWDRFKDVVLDEPAVIAKHGVAPASIPDLLALIGDTADGIPGLPGWGKASAGKLLAAYGQLAAIPDDPAAWSVNLRGADRLARALRDQRADADLYRVLATLRLDCPIACDPTTLAWRGVDRPALAAICGELDVDPSTIRL